MAQVSKYKHMVQSMHTNVAAKAWGFALCVLIISFVLLTRGICSTYCLALNRGASAPSAAIPSYLCIRSPCYRSTVKRLVLSTQCPGRLGGCGVCVSLRCI